MLMLLAPVAVFAQKFGHVDTQAIIQSLPEVSKVNGELEALGKQYKYEANSRYSRKFKYGNQRGEDKIEYRVLRYFDTLEIQFFLQLHFYKSY